MTCQNHDILYIYEVKSQNYYLKCHIYEMKSLNYDLKKSNMILKTWNYDTCRNSGVKGHYYDKKLNYDHHYEIKSQNCDTMSYETKVKNSWNYDLKSQLW